MLYGINCEKAEGRVYVRALTQSNSNREGLVVKCLPTKAQGRPLLLDQVLDKAVQEYIEATRPAGRVVNTSIVMAAAVGITRARNRLVAKFTILSGERFTKFNARQIFLLYGTCALHYSL